MYKSLNKDSAASLAVKKKSQNNYHESDEVFEEDTLPGLTLADSKQAVKFKNNGAGLSVRNGAPYNLDIVTPVTEKYTADLIPPGNATVKDGAFSLGINRFRQADGTLTKTQEILIQDDSDLARLISSDVRVNLSREERLKMVNDPVRRVFESYYAKFALEKYLNDKVMLDFYYKFSSDQFDYISDKYLNPEIITSFNNAKSGSSFEFDSQLGGFYHRIKKAINTLDVSDEAKGKIFEIYINRYINLSLRNDPRVIDKLPAGHWDNVFDAFKAPGKGRVEIKVDEGDMFRQADSYALGILRNFDVAPQDLILKDDITYADDYHGKLTAGKSTRCPDRLEIQDPFHRDAFKEDSYMKWLYEQGTGTYINGPSGTILIEQGAIRACKELHHDMTAEAMEKFLEVLALMFIYLDGGHSMHEISYALRTEKVQQKMAESFPEKVGVNKVGNNLFKDEVILKRSAAATVPFLRSLLQKDRLHQEIKKVYLTK